MDPSTSNCLTPPKSTVINAIDVPSVSLQRFDLLDLQPYTQEKVYATAASKDFHLFYVGRDDVHDILKHVLSRVSVSLYLNMFGFDDDELNDILMKSPSIPQSRCWSRWTRARPAASTSCACWTRTDA